MNAANEKRKKLDNNKVINKFEILNLSCTIRIFELL